MVFFDVEKIIMMKTKYKHLIHRLVICIMSITAVYAEEGKSITPPAPGHAETAMRCLICHGDTQKGQQRLAPPMVMVKMRYSSQAKTQKAFVKVLSDWVKKPDAKKSHMPGAVRRFNLMPAFPIPEAEMKLIAEYIYQTDFNFPSGCGPQATSAKDVNGKAAPQGCDETNCPPVKGGKSKVVPSEKGKSPKNS